MFINTAYAPKTLYICLHKKPLDDKMFISVGGGGGGGGYIGKQGC